MKVYNQPETRGRPYEKTITTYIPIRQPISDESASQALPSDLSNSVLWLLPFFRALSSLDLHSH